jgi:hypothetical protein
MTKTAERSRKTRKPAAKRVAAAKPRGGKAVSARSAGGARKTPGVKRAAAKKVAGRQTAGGYVVFESPVEPRHFTIEQIRRAVKEVVNG